MKFLEVENLRTRIHNFNLSEQPAPADTKTVLSELFELLEDYSPVWYKQEHRDRAIAALERR
jgi:hypothetical protein